MRHHFIIMYLFLAIMALSQPLKIQGQDLNKIDSAPEIANINTNLKNNAGGLSANTLVNNDSAVYYTNDTLQLSREKEKKILQARSRLYLAIALITFLLLIILAILCLYNSSKKGIRRLEQNNKTIKLQKQQLEKDIERLEKEETKLVELNKTRDKFFSIIAHDLKSPFTTLISFSNLLITTPALKDTDDFDEIIKGIFKTATSGYNLLENLLEWARSQTGNIEHYPEWHKLSSIFKYNNSLFKEIAKTKDITIKIPDVGDKKVFADENAMNCIIRNLLNNAIKFSYPGSNIEISVQNHDNYCVVSIKDYGIGMSSEVVHKLFKFDTSIKNNGTADEKGTGLGLLICKEFVERNNGEIWVESQLGKGSTFHFTVPVKEV